MPRKAPPAIQLQLDFDAVVEPRRVYSPDAFLRALKQRRVTHITEVRFKDNRQRIITLARDGCTLHIHECFREATDEVLQAIVTFLKAGRRSQAYHDAINALRDFWSAKAESAIEEDAKILAAVHAQTSSGTREQRAFIEEAYARLNAMHFGNALPIDFPIRISDRMASRFGHMRYHTLRDSTRIVLEIGINHSLFARGQEANLIDTLLHEMTHVEAWLVHGHKAHGAAWKRIARRVGCEARACSKKVILRRRRNAAPLDRVPARSWLPQLPQQGAA
jgi:hypothetical protein